MTYTAKYPAAFINIIADEGSKAEAIEGLQRTWDDLQAAKKYALELEGRILLLEDEVQKLEKTVDLLRRDI